VTAPWLLLAIALAGGVGAALRLVVDGTVRWAARRRPHTATLVVNVTGSFALGLVTGLAASAGLPHEWLLVLGGGLLGGYTTFGTASVEAVRLLLDGRRASGAGHAFATLVLSVAAAALGLLFGGA